MYGESQNVYHHDKNIMSYSKNLVYYQNQNILEVQMPTIVNVHEAKTQFSRLLIAPLNPTHDRTGFQCGNQISIYAKKW